MDAFRHIFAAWETRADLARDLGIPYQTVAAWRGRDSIPPAYWPQVVDAAQRRARSTNDVERRSLLHAVTYHALADAAASARDPSPTPHEAQA